MSQDISATIASTIVSFGNLFQNGHLLTDFMRLRKEVFIDSMGWPMPEEMGLEYDQYDHPGSIYCLVHADRRVLAGMRLTRTTARNGIYSYMIRDAQNGLLESIPQDLLHEAAPTDPHIWEASRLVIRHDIPAAERRYVQRRLAATAGSAQQDFAIASCLTLTPNVWKRWIGPVGVTMQPRGPALKIDGRGFMVTSVDFTPALTADMGTFRSGTDATA